MSPAKLSAGLRQIWQTAGDTALAGASSEIEPAHFLFGILEFLQTSEGQAEEKERKRASTRLSEAEVDIDKARKGLWAVLVPADSQFDANPTTQVRMSRSAESRSVFEAAAKAAHDEIDALDLLMALCRSGDRQVLTALGDGAKRILEVTLPSTTSNLSVGLTQSATLPSPGSTPVMLATPSISLKATGPELEVVHQCDASIVVRTPGPRVDKAEQFIALCELNWEAGTKVALEQMLRTALDGLMKVVRADRGAILVLDRTSGRWMLKTHSGGSTPRISMTSVQKAVEQKVGIIWKKGEDLSASQVDASLTEGIYCPILADDEVFGVVCLDSCSESVSFSGADLRMVTALAHQIGLFIAHQEMRRLLTSNMKAMERLLTSFSPRVRALLVQRVRSGKLQLGGERANVTVVFVDIRGFTKLAATMEPDDLADLLNDYFSVLSECVLRNEGTINDFVGDALVAVFGSPELDPKHCHNALVSAVEMQTAAAELTTKRKVRGQVSCEIGIGVHTGEVLHGFIGSNECMQYTVVGDVVNFAARYSTAAKGGTILVSPQVHALAWSEIQAERITIPTKHEGEISAYLIAKLRS